MKINSKLKAALNEAFNLKSEKKYKEAVEIYRQIIAEEKDDPVSIGIHYIDLGNAQFGADLDEEALISYKRATELLDGQKGDAILQRSYALQNMTDIFLRKNDPRAKIASTEALDILRAYPYTTTTDLANAIIRHFLVHMFIDNYVGVDDFDAVWKTVKEAQCEKIDQFYTRCSSF
jgi:tetratricopeptide (TPR) repeat protein